MLDESCGMAMQLALDGTRAFATLDLRIEYQKPATPGLASAVLSRHRSIAFVRAAAYQDAADDPVATAAACFMVGAKRANMLTDPPIYDDLAPTFEAPDDPTGPFANSSFARFLGTRTAEGGTPVMLFSPKIIGNPILSAIHGGMTGAFLETAAIVGVTRELGVAAPPKPLVSPSIICVRRALDSFVRVSIVKQGRPVVAFEAQAWQDEPSRPIDSAFGHVMLRRTGAEEEERLTDKRALAA